MPDVVRFCSFSSADRAIVTDRRRCSYKKKPELISGVFWLFFSSVPPFPWRPFPKERLLSPMPAALPLMQSEKKNCEIAFASPGVAGESAGRVSGTFEILTNLERSRHAPPFPNCSQTELKAQASRIRRLSIAGAVVCDGKSRTAPPSIALELLQGDIS